MEKFAVIVAGGSGRRMGTSLPKQFLELRGKPVLWHTINTFMEAYHKLKIILVLPEQYLSEGMQLNNMFEEKDRIFITVGGETRFHSVRNGLELVDRHSIVFVHDGVRCLVSKELVQHCYEQALIRGNAIPAIHATDTIRLETASGNELIDRNKVRIIQTPQTFTSEIIKTAFSQDYHESFTDEASVVETLGIKINLVEGEASNIKITRSIDMVIAGHILDERAIGL
jgi:2-C-methyl-D-erythritol 4-phosphate cytidylyltransferase